MRRIGFQIDKHFLVLSQHRQRPHTLLSGGAGCEEQRLLLLSRCWVVWVTKEAGVQERSPSVPLCVAPHSTPS